MEVSQEFVSIRSGKMTHRETLPWLRLVPRRRGPPQAAGKHPAGAGRHRSCIKPGPGLCCDSGEEEGVEGAGMGRLSKEMLAIMLPAFKL